MTERQLYERIRNHLLARRWTDSASAERVFAVASVKITSAESEEAWEKVVLPACLIVPGSASPDPEAGQQRDYFEQQLELLLLVKGAGDRLGEDVLLGAHQAVTSPETKGTGRGLLEVDKEVWAALDAMSDRSGVQLARRPGSRPAPIPRGGESGYMVGRAYGLLGNVTTFETHLPGRAFTATGSVSLAWSAPFETTDLVAYVIRRVAGKVPTPFPDGGTNVAPAAFPATTATDTPGAGTFTYSLFGLYADPGGTIGLHHSDFVHSTVVVP